MTKASFVLGIALLGLADAAMAERVYVKARGEVDLAPFRCETIPRDPNVRRVCYDPRAQYALVSLRGIWYHYCSVPQTTIAAMRRASSKSRFYNENMRGHFDCVEGAAPTYR